MKVKENEFPSFINENKSKLNAVKHIKTRKKFSFLKQVDNR